eukprot:g15914.t1
MANVEAATTAAADSGNLWGAESQGKVTRRRVLAAGGVLGAAALGLGLYFGLKEDGGQQAERNIISGQADANSLGCFVDKARDERVMEAQWTDETMTPDKCNTHCGERGYYYYALQWGIECWCAAETTDIDVYGLGTCDYACGGDEDQLCGGYYTFTAYEVGTEATSPSPTPSISTACSGGDATIRFASETAYFEGGGCGTLSLMYEAQGGSDGPLVVLDDSDGALPAGTAPTGRWLLTRNLRVVNGVTLELHGSDAGGDCDVLRIESTDDKYFELRGYGGNLSFRNTIVTSWDTDAGEEREYDGEPRSFIRCVTQFDDSDKWTCDGASDVEMGECRMDIIESVMGNMGYLDSESYGLTWKVRGFCVDLSNPEIFDDHNVYGDIIDSEIYGMYYGHYSYGHQDGVWTGNIMRNNVQYGFDPHDDSDNLEIAYNTVYGNGNHGIIASKRCNDVSIHDNEVYDGGPDAVGIFLHRSSDDALVYNNYVHDMPDAGLAIMESFNAEIYDNVFENTQYGMRISVGGANNYVHGNKFDVFSDYGIYTYEGSDAPDTDSDGKPKNNKFEGNTVSGGKIGVHLEAAVDNEFDGNTFDVEVFEFEDSTGTIWTGNEVGTACADGGADLASGVGIQQLECRVSIIMMREFVRQAFIGFFASHLIITVLLDSQALPFIEKAYPDFLKWLIQYHIDTNHDYFMAKPAPWFKAFIWLELLFQVPFFAYATAGFLARRNSVRIPCVIYGTSAATTVVGIVGDILASDEVTDPQRLRLICVYMPWLVIPSALVLMMAADPTPFGPGGSQPSASKQK